MSLSDRPLTKKIPPLEFRDGDTPAIDPDTFYNHLLRHGYSPVKTKNGTVEVRGSKNSRKMGIEIDGSQNTFIELDMDNINCQEPVYQSIFEELIERERRLNQAVELFVYGSEEEDVYKSLPSMADEGEDTELKTLKEEFQRLGEDIRDISEKYYDKETKISHMLMPYSSMFELHTGQTLEDSPKGAIPVGKSSKRENKDRNQHYLNRYLEEVLKTSLKEYEGEEQNEKYLRDLWLKL